MPKKEFNRAEYARKLANERWANPIEHEKQSERMKNYLSNFNVRKRMSEGARRNAMRPAERKRRSEAMKKRWQDPEYRELMLSKLRDPEHRAAASEKAKGRKLSNSTKSKLRMAGRINYLDNKAIMDERLANMNKRWEDPYEHKRLSEQAKLRWASRTPEQIATFEEARRRGIGRATSTRLKYRWIDPAYHEKHSGTEVTAKARAALAERWKDPKFVEYMSKMQKARWETISYQMTVKRRLLSPTTWKKMSEASKKYWASEGRRDLQRQRFAPIQAKYATFIEANRLGPHPNISAGMKRAWRVQPSLRAKHAIASAKAEAELRAKHPERFFASDLKFHNMGRAIALKRSTLSYRGPRVSYVRTPEHRKKMSEIKKAFYAQKGTREADSAIIRAYLAVPENRRARYEKALATKAKNQKLTENKIEAEKKRLEKLREAQQAKQAAKDKREQDKLLKQKTEALRRQKYREAARLLAQYGVEPVANQSLKYYETIIKYFN